MVQSLTKRAHTLGFQLVPAASGMRHQALRRISKLFRTRFLPKIQPKLLIRKEIFLEQGKKISCESLRASVWGKFFEGYHESTMHRVAACRTVNT